MTIPNSVTSIGFGTFASCTNLTSVTIPDSVAAIPGFISYPLGPDGGAFRNCTSLTSVTMGNGVTDIGDAAFEGCSSLTSVTIPNSVTSIGRRAFQICTSLTSVTIGNGVTNIGAGTFTECTSLISVTIGNGVTSIGGAAFESCTSLTSVYFKGNAPAVGGVFYNDNNVTVYYLSGTTGWDATFDGRPAVLWNPQIQTSDASFGLHGNQFRFNITGTADIPVLIEACTNLASPVWFPLQAVTLTNGLFHFSDSQWTNYPARFYGLCSP